MQMKLVGNELQLQDVDKDDFTVIKSWNKMVWDSKKQVLRGAAEPELLDRLAKLLRRRNLGLTRSVELRREQLHAIQDAVDRERMNPQPKPLYSYPVKMPLYAHQVRGANMCLLTFGWVQPEGV